MQYIINQDTVTLINNNSSSYQHVMTEDCIAIVKVPHGNDFIMAAVNSIVQDKTATYVKRLNMNKLSAIKDVEIILLQRDYKDRRITSDDEGNERFRRYYTWSCHKYVDTTPTEIGLSSHSSSHMYKHQIGFDEVVINYMGAHFHLLHDRAIESDELRVEGWRNNIYLEVLDTQVKAGFLSDDIFHISIAIDEPTIITHEPGKPPADYRNDLH